MVSARRVRRGTESGTMKGAMVVRTVTQLKLRSSDLVDEVNATRAPVVVTQKGVARAVLQDLRSWEETQASLAMLKLVVQAEHDIAAGQTVPHSAMEKRLSRALGPR
jgi:prevent-host-death family protein